MFRGILTENNGRLLLVLGLDGENMRRLQAGDPILVDGNAYGLGYPGDVLIVAGGTSADVVRGLQAIGLEPPITPDAAAALRPTPGNPVIVDIRKKGGQG